MGQSDRPEALEAYDVFQLTGDLVGFVHALGESTAIIVGHDWGACIASYATIFRPDLFSALALLSVPYVPRRNVNQSLWEQKTYPGKISYEAGLRSPMSESMLEKDVRATLTKTLHALSGDANPSERNFLIDPNLPRSNTIPPIPSWIKQSDLEYVVSEFQRNYYRNMDRNWALTPFLDGAKIQQPTLFIAGEKDPVIQVHAKEFQELETNVPNLRRKVLIPGVGHWTQQESPEETNRLLIEFLRSL